MLVGCHFWMLPTAKDRITPDDMSTKAGFIIGVSVMGYFLDKYQSNYALGSLLIYAHLTGLVAVSYLLLMFGVRYLCQ